MDCLMEDDSIIIFLKGVFLKDCSNDLFSIPAEETYEKIDFEDDFSDIETDLEEELKSEGVDFGEYMELPEKTDHHRMDDYKPLPMYFTNIDTWVKSTNLHCWYCDCRFPGIPCFISEGITKNFVEDKEVAQHKVYGNFCSFNCAVGYLSNVIDHRLQNDKKFKFKELQRLLFTVYEEFYGIKPDYISESPSKTCMLQFGGNKTAAAYRKIISKLDERVKETIKTTKIESDIVG